MKSLRRAFGGTVQVRRFDGTVASVEALEALKLCTAGSAAPHEWTKADARRVLDAHHGDVARARQELLADGWSEDGPGFWYGTLAAIQRLFR